MSSRTKTEPLVWTKASTHPLEYRSGRDGAICILRVHDGRWTAAIHRDSEPVELTTHATYWHAKRHCEEAS